MTSLFSSSAISSINHAKDDSMDNKSTKIPSGSIVNAIGGRIRRRVVSLSRPATGATQLLSGCANTETPDVYEEFFGRVKEAFKSSDIAELQSSCPTSSREHWDVVNSQDNQQIWVNFTKLCSLYTLSTPLLSATSPSIKAHIALSTFTPLQKLRVILLGSNRKAFRIGEDYLSPIRSIEEFVTRSDHTGENTEQAEDTFSAVSQKLHEEFTVTVKLMENFIFPVRLIEPFNSAINSINQSPFLKYILVLWRAKMSSFESQGIRINGRDKQSFGQPEFVFVEWYFASSPPLITSLLCTLLMGVGEDYDRLVEDLYGDAKPTSGGVLRNILSKELNAVAVVRRGINVAIDNLFWQRVEMVRPSSDSSAVIRDNEETLEAERIVRIVRRQPSGRARDNKCLRKLLAVRGRAECVENE